MKLVESFSLLPLALLEYRSNYTEIDAISNADGCSSICHCLVKKICSHLYQSHGNHKPYLSRFYLTFYHFIILEKINYQITTIIIPTPSCLSLL